MTLTPKDYSLKLGALLSVRLCMTLAQKDPKGPKRTTHRSWARCWASGCAWPWPKRTQKNPTGPKSTTHRSWARCWASGCAWPWPRRRTTSAGTPGPASWTTSRSACWAGTGTQPARNRHAKQSKAKHTQVNDSQHTARVHVTVLAILLVQRFPWGSLLRFLHGGPRWLWALSACLSACLPIYLSINLSICLSVWRSINLSTFLST